MTNPWMSLWLSAANSWAGAARAVWTAEMRRQQTAITQEMIRQAMRFWAYPLTAPSAERGPKRRR
ncbi:MAG TPA: hypothetical protein VLE23_12530 [Geminicoccaceae bacterium]|nr:hypothetical protein [Geminicoccaceae bacterium]